MDNGTNEERATKKRQGIVVLLIFAVILILVGGVFLWLCLRKDHQADAMSGQTTVKTVRTDRLAQMTNPKQTDPAPSKTDGTSGSGTTSKESVPSEPKETEKNQPTVCAHEYGEVTVKTPANCLNTGVGISVCKLCGEQKTEILPKTDHTAVTDKGKAATCTQKGLSDGSHCSVCGLVLVEQYTTEPLGHSYSEWTVVRAATCTAEGRQERKCQNCGDTETKSLEKTSHDYVGGKCTYCGEAQAATEHMNFSLSKDGSYYICNGLDPYYWAAKKDPETIVIPATYNGRPVKEIGDNGGGNGAFAFDHMKYVIIPEGIEVIRGGAFRGCDKLVSVTLPKSLNKIYQGAFNKCGNLETVYFQNGNWKYVSYGSTSSVDFSDAIAAANRLRNENLSFGEIAYYYR